MQHHIGDKRQNNADHNSANHSANTSPNAPRRAHNGLPAVSQIPSSLPLPGAKAKQIRNT
jgi:hypothetical protein